VTPLIRTGVSPVKRSLLALSLACGLAGPAMAQTAAPAADSRTQTMLSSRIRTYLYTSDDIYPVVGTLGFQSIIEFAPDERVVNVAIGDAMGWQITPIKDGHRLFLKPLEQAPLTNMTVVTNRRQYLFELSVDDDREKLTYVTRFYYQPETVVKEKPPASPLNRNTAYTVQGAPAVSPSRVFDDGRVTYFAWPEQADLPAIFVIGADGAEGLANAVVKNGFLVVDQIAPRFVLRSDKAVATVVNNGWRAPQASPEKTP